MNLLIILAITLGVFFIIDTDTFFKEYRDRSWMNLKADTLISLSFFFVATAILLLFSEGWVSYALMFQLALELLFIISVVVYPNKRLIRRNYLYKLKCTTSFFVNGSVLSFLLYTIVHI